MSFAAFNFSAHVLNAVVDAGYLEPTTVQQQTIPHILQGLDVMVKAQAGTGKTASFALPLIDNLLRSGRNFALKQAGALVVTAQEETARQIQAEINSYAHATGLGCLFIADISQANLLASGVDILVLTIESALELVVNKELDLSQSFYLVLDETQMITPLQIRTLIKQMPNERQTLLFAAEFNQQLTDLAREILQDPKIINIELPQNDAQIIEHQVYHVLKMYKRHLLAHLFKEKDWLGALIFMRTRKRANILAKFLVENGVNAQSLHESRSTDECALALDAFKLGALNALVVTDVSARAIDVADFPLVINYDLPNLALDYIYRIARTGILGSKGTCISLVCAEEEKFLRGIERFIKQEIITQDTPDFPVPNKPDNDDNSSRNRKPYKKSGFKARKDKKTKFNDIDSASEIIDEDNFGNSVNYVSPYAQNQDKTVKAKSFTRPTNKGSKPLVGKKMPKSAVHAGKSFANTVNKAGVKGPKSVLRRRGYRSLMSDKPLADVEHSYSARSKKSKPPIILHKSFKVLTPEQLSSLQKHLDA